MEITNYIVGKITSIGDPIAWGEKTEVIDVIIEMGAKYKNYPCVQFKNMMMKKVDGFNVGETVCIGFKLEGYNNESNGKNFTKAVGMSMFKLEEAAPTGRSMKPEPEMEIPRGNGADDFLNAGGTPMQQEDDSDLPF